MMTNESYNEREFEIWINSIKSGLIDDFQNYYQKEFLEREYDGKFPIHYACINGQFEITKQLIDWHCNIEALDKNNWKPLHHACRENRVQIVKLLIENKCEIDPKNEDKWTPLHTASGYGHSEIVKILIDNNCVIEAITADGWTPLHNACRFGHLENVKILLNKYCEIEICDKDKCTPIHYVCQKDYVDILQLLLDKNCDIEACDKNDWRPIHYACANNNVKIVEILLQNICNIDAQTSERKSPLDLAKEKNNEDIIRILKEELEHVNLVNNLVSSMNTECIDGCDHHLCYKSLRLKTFDKGELIGRGGFGKVFKIKSSKTKCAFAIKTLRINKFLSSDLAKMEKEINTNKEVLKHKRIITFYGAIKTTNNLVIFMEFACGGTIQCQINKNKTIPIDQVIHYSRQILEGLEYLHGLNRIHRDVKPSNILLTPENNVKLADFDLLRITKKSSGNSSKITTFCGTPNFIAPEIIIDEQYKFSVDIWSLGATIINMITGKAPYEDLETSQTIMFKIASTKQLEIPSDQMISNAMRSFIREMLNPDPSLRPTASQLLKHKILKRS